MESQFQFSLLTLFIFSTTVAIVVWLSDATFIYPFGPLMAWFFTAAAFAVLAKIYRNWRLKVGSLLMMGLGVFAFPLFFSEGHAVPPSLLKQISVGSTDIDVIRILGEPSSSRENIWVYSNLTWCHVTITFDKESKIKSIDHDH